jgi:hypothetical protein
MIVIELLHIATFQYLQRIVCSTTTPNTTAIQTPKPADVQVPYVKWHSSVLGY